MAYLGLPIYSFAYVLLGSFAERVNNLFFDHETFQRFEPLLERPELANGQILSHETFLEFKIVECGIVLLLFDSQVPQNALHNVQI